MDLDDSTRGLNRVPGGKRKRQRDAPGPVDGASVILGENVDPVEAQIDRWVEVDLAVEALLDEEVDRAPWATSLLA